MLTLEQFKNARWQDIYAFFVSGDPPLIIKLLVINTIFLVYFIFRKTRGGRQEYRTSYLLQALLIASNCIVMFQTHMLPDAHFLRHLDASREFAHVIYERLTG